VIRTRVFGSNANGSTGRNTLPSNVASMVLTMIILAGFLGDFFDSVSAS
jgi:hypothetical protein